VLTYWASHQILLPSQLYQQQEIVLIPSIGSLRSQNCQEVYFTKSEIIYFTALNFSAKN